MHQTHLELITDTYNKCGIMYALKQSEGYTYLILCNELNKHIIKGMTTEKVCNIYDFMEFDEEGNIASY